LNDFFSRTTRPIATTKLGRNMLGEWRFRFVEMKGSNKEQNMDNFHKSSKSSHEPLAGMHSYLA